MSTYKLYYFNTRGSAEPIRIMFAQAGVKYEDVRFEREQWAQEYKQKMPFGRAPDLEVDGTLIAGTWNILRFLGMKFDGGKDENDSFLSLVLFHKDWFYGRVGMAGKDDISDAVLGGASDYMNDIIAKIIQWYQAKDEDKAKLAQEFKEKTGPEMLGILQKHVRNGHINGSETLSWADIQCHFLLEHLSEHFSINIADYPELKKLYDGVNSQPNIKKYMEERPKTDH